MAITKAGAINLEYFTEGSGPPLLMIMGFAGSAYSWGDPFLERLRKQFTVIRFSNRGTGESDKPQEQTTVRMMADDAVALLDALRIERAHLMGISMGGMIAQEIAINHPQRVNRLVLGCTWLGVGKAVTADPATNAAMTYDPNLSQADMIRKAWYALVTDGFQERNRAFLEGMLESMIAHPTPLDTIMKQIVALSTFTSVERAAQITMPTLVVHGDADRLMPPINGDYVAEAIPGAEKRTIEGAGHMFFWEKPEESAQVVTEFLSRVPAGA